MARYKGKIIGLAAMLICTVILIVVAATLKKNKSDDADNRVSSGTVSSDNKSYTAYDFAMGTSLSMTVYGDMKSDGSSKAEEECKKVFGLIKKLDEEIISWRNEDSLISRLNSDGRMEVDSPDQAVLARAIAVSLGICRASDGALDITLRPLLDVWRIEDYADDPESFVVPDKATLLEAAKKTGCDKVTVELDMSNKKYEPAENVRSIDLGGKIADLGAVGKGFALDYIYDEYISTGDSPSVVISVGGSILVYGNNTKEGNFKIGIRDPEGSVNDMIGVVELPSGCGKVCISTSGNYEKYIDKDNVRYHHIIDPSTMYPADSGLVSVTVVCSDDSVYPKYSGLISDGLSTACFIMGKDRSKKLLKEYGAEAVFIDKEGNITVTDGLKNRFILY